MIVWNDQLQDRETQTAAWIISLSRLLRDSQTSKQSRSKISSFNYFAYESFDQRMRHMCRNSLRWGVRISDNFGLYRLAQRNSLADSMKQPKQLVRKQAATFWRLSRQGRGQRQPDHLSLPRWLSTFDCPSQFPQGWRPDMIEPSLADLKSVTWSLISHGGRGFLGSNGRFAFGLRQYSVTKIFFKSHQNRLGSIIV